MGWTLLVGFALLASAGPALAVPGAGGPAASEPRIPGGRLFARLTVEKRDLVLQEVFDFTLSVHSRGPALGREIALLNREAAGLNFLPFDDLGSRPEATEEGVFEVHRFRGRGRAVATGSFAVQPTVRLSVVVAPGRGRGRGAPGEAPADRAEVRQVDLQPPALTVQVRPLPEAGRPESFAGAVGSFTFSAFLRPSAAVVGEPVTLTMEIAGRGNIESVSAPRVQAGEEFKVHEPKLLRKEAAEGGSRGRLVFEQVLVPRSAAATAVPAVSFAYFDPAGRGYRTLVDGPFPLSVRASAQRGAVIVEAPPSGPAARRLSLPADIAPLKTEPGSWGGAPARPWHASAWFLALQLVPPGVLIALFVMARRRERVLRDTARARRRLAPEAARSGIASAREALRGGDARRFHGALWEALAAFLRQRLDLLPGEISREAAAERLSRAGLDARELERLGEIFRLLEQRRFAPPPGASAGHSGAEREEMSRLLEDVERLLAACEAASP